jgi:hypothetical protein
MVDSLVQSLVSCVMFYRPLVVIFVLFPLDIILIFIYCLTVSHYPFGIFKLFFLALVFHQSNFYYGWLKIHIDSFILMVGEATLVAWLTKWLLTPDMVHYKAYCVYTIHYTLKDSILTYPLRLPYIHLYLCSLHLHFETNYLQSQIFQPIRLTVSGRDG